MMIHMIKKIQQDRRVKKDLLAFLSEMETNLENFYVMDQRQFITHGYALCSWEAVKDLACIKKHESILVCMKTLEQFNALYKEHKEYEQWYTTDLKNKTPENARKLHGMKHELDKKLKLMESIIIPAGQTLEKEMLDQGLLKA